MKSQFVKFVRLLLCAQLNELKRLILLIMILSDLKAHRQRKRNNTVNKSNTVINLPGITKPLKNSQTERKANKISYIDSMNNISPTVQYQGKGIQFLNKQQSQLKELLKKMNTDSLQMIDLIRPKKKPFKQNKSEIILVADSQILNSKKALENMQHQIQKLQEKYVRIVRQQQEEELLNKIKSIKEEICEIKESNLNIKVGIDKDGKQIVKQFTQQGFDQKLSILEADNLSADQRLQRIKSQTIRVANETQKIQQKSKQCDLLSQKILSEYQKIKEEDSLEIANKERQLEKKHKRYQMQNIKKKIDFINTNLQYKYFKLLRQLQSKKTICQQLNKREESFIPMLDSSKQKIEKLQQQVREAKKRKMDRSRLVLDFLQNNKKSKDALTFQEGTNQVFQRLTTRLNHENSLINQDQNRKWHSQLADPSFDTNLNSSKQKNDDISQQTRGFHQKIEPLSPQTKNLFQTAELQAHNKSKQQELNLPGIIGDKELIGKSSAD